MTRLLAVAFVLLTGCASVTQTLDPDKFYKHDFALKVNGIEGKGVLVVPRAATYHVEGSSPGKLDLLTFGTCHREWAPEKLGSSFKYDYTPSPGLEDQPDCPVHLGGYEQIKGRHAWGFITSPGAGELLPASLKCNGESMRAVGTTVCQAREGLLQEIDFDVPVRTSPDERCKIPIAADAKHFIFPMPKKECVILFMEQGGDKRIHRLTTLGYESILIRQD